MAKVTGPLMSMDASGAYGGTLVFSKWKGRNVVRQLVTPADPKSAGQEAARNRMRVTGAIQSWVNTTTTKASGETLADKDRIAAMTPAGYAWNGYLVETCQGAGGMTYDDARTAFAALTAPQKAAWETTAGALSPILGSVYQTQAGGGADTPITGGEVFFIYQYGLAQIGLALTPGAVPPTYA